MASNQLQDLVETYIALLAKRRTFNSKNEYLAWRSGVVVGLLASIADNDSLINSALYAAIKKKAGGSK